MKAHAFFLLLFLVLAAPAIAQPTIIIRNCYDGDTCTSSTGEKIRLACIDTPELQGARADPIPAKAARDYLNGLVAGEEVSIRRITKDRYGRTVAEISKDGINIQNDSSGKAWQVSIRDMPSNALGANKIASRKFVG